MAKHEAAAKRVRGEDVEESEAKRPRGPPDAEEERPEQGTVTPTGSDGGGDMKMGEQIDEQSDREIFGESDEDIGMDIGSLSRNVKQKTDGDINAVVRRELKKLGCSMDKIVDVSEVFCKDRLTARCGRYGLNPGFALDYSTGWDLDEPAQEMEARQMRKETRPRFLMASPECTAFTQLLNFGTITERAKAELIEKGRRHLNVCIDMYNEQLDEGHHFIHEHPHGARSWSEEGIVGLLRRPEVYWVRNDQCASGQVTTDFNGFTMPAQKTTGWLTSSRRVAQELARFQCPNRVRPGAHTHAHLINGRAAAAAAYPPRLVAALLRGIRRELQGRREVSINSMDVGTHGHEEPDFNEYQEYYDDITGAMLPKELAKAPRIEELEFLNQFPVYEKVLRAQASGKNFVKVRWCDVNKGDGDKMQVRSRLVAKEFRWRDPFMEGTFAATPPLEALRYVFHWMTTVRRRNGRKVQMKMIVLDVSRAHFHPKAVRETYIELPEEDATEGFVARLLRTMYGTRDAAHEYDSFSNEKICAQGYRHGASCPCIYGHEEELSIGWRHGDDMIFGGEDHWVLPGLSIYVLHTYT